MAHSIQSMTAPPGIIAGAIVTYSGIFSYLQARTHSQDEVRVVVKAISAAHSLATTGLTLLVLNQPWTTVQDARFKATLNGQHDGPARLDDSNNSWIVGRNSLANFITAWEAGYLIYDTGALLFLAHSARKLSFTSLRAAVIKLLKSSPVFVVHHALLIGALLYLQTYIAKGRERGLRVIATFFLMNASNPLLHLRWWRRKVTGHSNLQIDLALATVFALTRFGSVYSVFKAYGDHHGLSAWQAVRWQRWQCKAGTGLLTVLNAIWWLALLKQMTSSKQARGTKMS